LALKIIYNEQDTDFHGLRFHSLARKAVRKVQKAENPLPFMVHMDWKGTPEGERAAETGSRSRSPPSLPHGETNGCHFQYQVNTSPKQLIPQGIAQLAQTRNKKYHTRKRRGVVLRWSTNPMTA